MLDDGLPRPDLHGLGRAPDNALVTASVSPANCGRRIGVLIVAYNAVTTIAKVLERIPADVWENVEEVVVLDDASRDHTYQLAAGLKLLSGLAKLTLIKNDSNLGCGGHQKLGY